MDFFGNLQVLRNNNSSEINHVAEYRAGASFVAAPVSLYAYGYYRAFLRQSKTYEGRFVKFRRRRVENAQGRLRSRDFDRQILSMNERVEKYALFTAISFRQGLQHCKWEGMEEIRGFFGYEPDEYIDPKEFAERAYEFATQAVQDYLALILPPKNRTAHFMRTL